MNKPLEVDAFAIEIETLYDASQTRNYWQKREAMGEVVEVIIENLSLDDKKRFEEYQEQNDPCR